ncbi:hypothetical protein [Lonepinella sp. BR2271]|uniref:hypothetical protein n=1 Tax=Lonepinella sp. BR2271 TaxID=3434550 RepID=UPI003F6DEF0F
MAWLKHSVFLFLFFFLSVAQAEDWILLYSENFDREINSQTYDWVKDPLGKESPWYVDQFGDDGEAFKAISDPRFSQAMKEFAIYRQRFSLGQDGWLTAEIAAVDKNLDGKPDAIPYLNNVKFADGSTGIKLNEPEWDSGIILRSSQPLPQYYRIETTVTAVNFGGKRNHQWDYDGKRNGYDIVPCKTGYPWTFRGALENKSRCDYYDVSQENGFYYLAILDYPNPAPHSNPVIHFHRKVVMDSYNSGAAWSQRDGVCNLATKQIIPMPESPYNMVNAIFIQGNKFKASNNNMGNEYIFKTECGNFNSAEKITGVNYNNDIVSAVELLPDETYQFAVERNKSGYTLEMSGKFARVGYQRLRYSHAFIENGVPIWHYNQHAEEYDGRFNQHLIHQGFAGSYTSQDIWKAGSAYPDYFIIGDPHINYYEGNAVIKNIKLYRLRSERN